MHLDDERAERLLHGELAPADAARARNHLADCSECRFGFERRMRDEEQIFAGLRSLDHPAAAVTSPDEVIARAAAHRPGWRRWAAALLLGTGLAGALYAVPGSPVRRWLDSIARTPAPVVPESTPGPAASPGGIAVDPGLGLVIQFTSADSASRLIVRLTDGKTVEVQAPGGAATYTAAAGRIIVEPGQGPITFEVEIPKTAPRVEIRVGGKMLFEKGGDRLAGAGRLEWTGAPFVIRF